MQSSSKNSYWKFGDPIDSRTAEEGREEVRQAGYTVCSDSIGDSSLRIWLARIDVGLICYESCATSELEKFVKDRHIMVHTAEPSRKTLIDVLTSSDNERTFPHFMELPAELRNNIYEEVMASYASPLMNPAQPPLALVSRQVRDEAISTFYSCCPIEVELVAKLNGIWTFEPESLSFLNNLRPIDLARIRDLRFQVYSFEIIRCNELSISVMKSAEGKYSISVNLGTDGYCLVGDRAGISIKSCHDLENHLKAFIETQKLSSGETKLTLSTVYGIRRSIEIYIKKRRSVP